MRNVSHPSRPSSSRLPFRSSRARFMGALALLLCLLIPLTLSRLLATPSSGLPTLEQNIPCTFNGVGRIVAVGDIHGDLEAIRDVLKMAGLTDGAGHWAGGKTHLVQTGDFTDRGPSSRAVMDLLMRLQSEAGKAGGEVHVLLGNHEAMNMTGDLRYVSPEDLASYADLAPKTVDSGQSALEGHRQAFGLEGRYGRWLRQLPASIRINGTLFVHGGIAASVPSATLLELNFWVRQDLFSGHPPGGAVSRTGPLWYRGLAEGEETALRPDFDAILKRFGASRMVVGHTRTEGRIVSRFDGRLFQIDVGMCSGYGGHRAALEIQGNRFTALYLNGKEVLIPGDKGAASSKGQK